MPKVKRVKVNGKDEMFKPALSPEARENQLISLAYDEVERRIRDGTATSQELVHFLKLGSSRDRIEKEILSHQNELIQAKTEALQSAKHIEELYSNAIEAMRSYTGSAGSDDENV